MRKFTKAFFSLALIGCTAFSLSTVQASAATNKFTTPATGYTRAEEVKYKTGEYIANWGARGEDCVFLSSKAQAYYTSNYTYEVLSKKSGGTSSSAPSSTLYKALNKLMTDTHDHITTYDELRYEYRYTDCLRNDTENISWFYLGETHSSQWDSADTWNREHCWPKSKTSNPKTERDDSADMHMIRPTQTQENSRRGNTAYGESSGYYDPDKNGCNVRGDCARMMLYVYVRWGNTNSMWGASGVMESLDVLLRWMAEDPVDTWEMGRNDSIESITGNRNVFIDYPEYAFLLFNQQIPQDMPTPSKSLRPDDSTDTSTDTDTDLSTDSDTDADTNVGGSSNSESLSASDEEEGSDSTSESGSEGIHGASCLASVESVSASVLVGIIAAYVLKKRKFSK